MRSINCQIHGSRVHGAALTLLVVLMVAVRPQAAPDASPISSDDLKEWLGYIASDELQGRANYSAGLGLAAAYIGDHLRAWGVRPAGDRGSYLQTVRVLGVRSSSRSSVTIRVGAETRTFKDGEGVVFPPNAGGRQTVTLDRVEFVGYGLELPGAHTAFSSRDVNGAGVVWLGSKGPKDVDAQYYRRLLDDRSRLAIEGWHAAATITEPPPPDSARGARETSRRANAPPVDFTTSERLDNAVVPAITASDAFLAFLFSRAPTPYQELKRRSEAQEPLPSFPLDGVRITFNVDHQYEVVRTQLTQNVVGIVEGSDARLRSTYVAFGAHYDHLGYADREVSSSGTRPAPLFGRTSPDAPDDRVWNGADDDGSGTVALMALAKAFATAPRPKRSVLFVWHSGEELGTYGSRYFADYPTVPLDSIVAVMNIDMIGRNRDDKTSESNTVYLVGSDRISTELDEITRAANAASSHPLTLNYELNDPSDPEEIYYRSDHHSYAVKGIPVVFLTTGLHPDYHSNTDEVARILFDKLTRIAQLAHEAGARIANLDHPPLRDNKGPRPRHDAK